MNFLPSKGIVSIPFSIGVLSSKKAFHGRWGTKFFGHIYWAGRSIWKEVNDQIIPRGREGGGWFHKWIFQHFEHCKSEDFLQSWWDIHLHIKPWSVWIMCLSFTGIVKKFQRSCHVQFSSSLPWPWYTIWKVNCTNRF